MHAYTASASQLRISEIFHSLQGETSRAGLPTVFVRLTGCPLRCSYCDTAYAFSGGQSMNLAAILEEVGRYGTRYVTVTGGEPLAQKGCLELLRALCDAGYEVSLETGGALDVSGVDARVMKVLDIKTPGSGEVEKKLQDVQQQVGKELENLPLPAGADQAVEEKAGDLLKGLLKKK